MAITDHWRAGLRIGAALALVGAITGFDFFVLRANTATTAFTYLLAVLALATRMGARESIAASVASMVCYNLFFLPPIGTLTIADPQNWIALLTFLVTALTASHLSAEARREALSARRQKEDVERLYQLSRALMLIEDQRPLFGQVAQHIREALQVEEADLYELATGATAAAGPEQPEIPLADLTRSALEGTVILREPEHVAVLPVSLGGRKIGSLGVRGKQLSEPALHAAANLAAIAIERTRAREAATAAETAKESARLKSTLLDALAHEFKTPLTAIKAAAGGILPNFAAGTEREMLTVIEEETDRLNLLVTESIEMARIEGGQIKLRHSVFSPEALIARSLERFAPFLEGRELTVEIEKDLPEVDGDENLVSLVINQLMNNAVKYSTPGSPIAVAARRQSGGVAIDVASEGEAVPAEEREAIFRRFFRGRNVRAKIPGTGLGLSIARDIVKSHGGDIGVETDERGRNRFRFTLPVEEADDQRQDSDRGR